MQGDTQGDIEVSSLIGCDWEPKPIRFVHWGHKGIYRDVRNIGYIWGIKRGHTGGYRGHRGM